MQVEIYNDSVEITNPGWFVEGQDPKAHLAGDDNSSLTRNMLISQTLYKSEGIEAFGTGIPRIRDACKEAGVEFEYVRTAFGTKFVFHRKDAFADNAADNLPEVADNLPEVAEWPPAGWGALGVTDRAVLLHLYRHGESRTSVISNNTGIPERTVRSSLGRLAGKGLVFPHGSNRNRSYRLS